jgi:hypothetical protein
MQTETRLANDEFNDAVLLSQFNDLIRRGFSRFNGEYRLLWAVLEDAIRDYLVNAKCSNPKQRKAFDEVCAWFFPPPGIPQGLFGFEGVCEALGIDSDALRRRLAKLQVQDLPMRRYGRALRIARIPRSSIAA